MAKTKHRVRILGTLLVGIMVLALLGAAGADGLEVGTRVEGTDSNAILILRNLGSGTALKADNAGTGTAILATTAAGHAVHAITNDATKSAVFGIRTSGNGLSGRSDTNDGVVGVTLSPTKSGIWGHSVAGVGVAGSSGTNDGVVGTTQAAGKSGVYGWSDQGIGVSAYSVNGTALYVNGTSIFRKYASFEGGHGDIAENYRAGEPVTAGDVVIISEGMTLVLSREAYDTRVAGIIAGDPSLRLGGGVPDSEGVPLAIVGRVPCRVDASYGAIQAGDLLVTSPTPGHAMKAEPLLLDTIPLHRPGTILGKALESLSEGIGVIEVLVTLQ
ncbi:hypothetical protein IH601_09230 [Candidatus Bipolaricaulota bacterium]|nr:hypothetical protein [Candidatus Bipolaricaulota bacterium]